MTYYQICNYSYTTGATSGAGNAYPSGAPDHTPDLGGVRVTRSLVLCVVFCRFVLLSYFFWPFCCLSIFDLRILFTSLVSSNSSYADSQNIGK